MTSPRAETPMAFVQAILLAYDKYGRDASGALERAQITPKMARDASLRITAIQMEAIAGAAMQELDDEALGWFSRRLPWGSYGMLARASVTAPTLGVALERWCRNHRLIADDLSLSLSPSRGAASVTIVENRPLGAFREFCLVSILRNILGYACWLVDSHIPLTGSAFPFPAPPHRAAYDVLFSRGTQFDAPMAQVSFDPHYLALPIRRDERATRLMLQRALKFIVQPYRRDRLVVQRVRELFRVRTEALINADRVATALNMSKRSLHRHLQAEGKALQELKDEIRQERAADLLRRSSRPVKQIAEVLGFSNERTFARAFAGWTGMSPAEFRRNAAPAGLPALDTN